MIARSLILPQTHSFFLFGARGTGKTSLLHELWNHSALYIDLLNLETEARYQAEPENLYKELSQQNPRGQGTVIIDEIQRVPKLLDVVHRKIEETKLQFILTGSSARKLKSGAANLLAGRAFVFHLFPFTAEEIGSKFDLLDALQYGTLPKVVTFEDTLEKRRFLKSYGLTYLKEEVWGEQLIRKAEPFRKFLPLAAQTHGQVVNYSKIARDVGVDDTTVQNYFSILEDTLVGFLLPAYSGSIRKQLRSTPKFYLFDNGVKRALEGTVDFPLVHGSFEYGTLFEQFVIVEIMRRVAYAEIELGFSYIATEGGAEIDLVLSRGTKVIALIEIKSSSKIDPQDLRHLVIFKDSFKGAKSFCLYGGEIEFQEDGIAILPWKKGIEQILSVILPKPS